MDLKVAYTLLSEYLALYYKTLEENIFYLYQLILSLPLLTTLQNHGAVISVTLYLLWFVKAYLSRTELVCKKGSYMHQLVEKFPSFHSGYRPTVWCFPAFLNTVVFSLIQRCVKHNYTREMLKLPDGGQIAIDWTNLEAKNDLVVLVLPGLTGSSKENYVSHFVEKAVKAGCKAVVMNYRGIECDLLTPRTYCATNLEDLHFVVEYIKEKYPNDKLFAIGVSLGGIKLGGYLAKHYDECLISNAMIVSVPFNVFRSANELEKSTNLFFNRILTKNLFKYFDRYKHLFENDERFDFNAIRRCQSIREMDINFVSKQFGYKSYEEYYREACLDAKVQDIKVPTMFLNAADDMFSPAEAFPLDKFSSNPNIALVMTKYGGHISFVEGLCPTGCNYACRLLNDYLSNVILESKSEVKQKREKTVASASAVSPSSSSSLSRPIFDLN